MLTHADIDWDAERKRRQDAYYADVERRAGELIAHLEPSAYSNRATFCGSSDVVVTELSTKATEQRKMDNKERPSFEHELGDYSQSVVSPYEDGPAMFIRNTLTHTCVGNPNSG